LSETNPISAARQPAERHRKSLGDNRALVFAKRTQRGTQSTIELDDGHSGSAKRSQFQWPAGARAQSNFATAIAKQTKRIARAIYCPHHPSTNRTQSGATAFAKRSQFQPRALQTQLKRETNPISPRRTRQSPPVCDQSHILPSPDPLL
jgi:hypothetical protein